MHVSFYRLRVAFHEFELVCVDICDEIFEFACRNDAVRTVGGNFVGFVINGHISTHAYSRVNHYFGSFHDKCDRRRDRFIVVGFGRRYFERILSRSQNVGYISVEFDGIEHSFVVFVGVFPVNFVSYYFYQTSEVGDTSSVDVFVEYSPFFNVLIISVVRKRYEGIFRVLGAKTCYFIRFVVGIRHGRISGEHDVGILHDFRYFKSDFRSVYVFFGNFVG